MSELFTRLFKSIGEDLEIVSDMLCGRANKLPPWPYDDAEPDEEAQ